MDAIHTVTTIESVRGNAPRLLLTPEGNHAPGRLGRRGEAGRLGTGVVVSESGAILVYLARKSGKLMPQDLAGEARVLRWCFAALNTIELPVLSLWFFNLSGGKDSKPSEALRGWAEMRLQQLDGWLTKHPFIASEDFTIADILMAHVLDAGTQWQMLRQYPNLVAYRARCTERPAWKKAIAAYVARVEAV